MLRLSLEFLKIPSTTESILLCSKILNEKFYKSSYGKIKHVLQMKLMPTDYPKIIKKGKKCGKIGY